MSIGRVVAVASGKGGVGKSTVALGLGRALAESGRRVGILDADLYGPDIPLMMGVTRTEPATSLMLGKAAAFDRSKTRPFERDGIKVMSLQFLLSESQSFSAAGPLAGMLIGRLWTSVAWGDLDYLIVDLPPGTGDISQNVVQSLPIDGVVVVVTPEDASHLDTKKFLDFLGHQGIEVLGGVENMSSLQCPHCGESVPLFTAAAQSRTIWSNDLACLVRLPFDQPSFGGRGAGLPEGPIGDGFRRLARRVTAALPRAQP